MNCSQAILFMYAVSWLEGGGKQGRVHVMVTNLEQLIDEAEPCRHLAIVIGCTLERKIQPGFNPR
jgi:hypothetical protein